MRILFVFILIPFTITFSQELNSTVTVNYEGLSVENRELLVDFAGVIESYLNSTQFTGTQWKGQKIDCAFTVFFTSAANETDYSAQVVIVSTRPVFKSTRQSPMLTISDANWSFRYVPNQALYANQSTFDPLTSFLDFYANIIIGFDWETWADLGGTPYFKKAFDILNLSVGSPYKKGWEQSSASYSKWGLCQDLLNDKYRAFREAFYVYHYGVDEIQIRKKDGQDKIVNLITVLEDMQKRTGINSVLIKQFFDTKNGEIVELLKDYPDVNIFLRLKKIDPSHSAKYDELLR
ncbi:MAG TPA: hypothetical protein DHV28_18060 [Ignavibacteriales bacterium]|nr:hypothetical protein [Ignavibacteriales bacterium]